MCVDHRLTCRCGNNFAHFNLRDEALPFEAVKSLFCPNCSTDITFDHESMLSDNGWIIEFDLNIVQFIKNKLPKRDITPEILFDEGYCTWRGIYPTDHLDSLKERGELLELSKIDKKKYIEEFKTWTIKRMERLANEGWRKANVE
jgi:hypothetical protein